MRRRAFLRGLGGAALWPIGAFAQVPGRVYRLGFFTSFSRTLTMRDPSVVASMRELRQAGFAEWRNLTVLDEGFDADETDPAAAAAKLVEAAPDVIYAGAGRGLGKAARAATRTIPIVTITEDVVDDGLSTSLARPDRNVTGLSYLSRRLDAKRGDLLCTALPGLRRMAVLADPDEATPAHIQELTDTARARGVELLAFFAKTGDEIDLALDAAKASGAGAVNWLASPLSDAHRQRVIARAEESRLPVIYEWPNFASEGGLMGYGMRWEDMRRITTAQIIKVLSGVPPAQIPIEQPTRFELAINLKTAGALGLDFPAALLAQANEVIE